MAHSGKTITFATDLLPNEDGIYNLGKVDANNSSNNKRWNIFGNLTGNADTATSWANSTTVYVDLTNSGQSSSIQGGESTEVALQVNGILGTANGGTGLNSYAQYDILYASATNTLNKLSKGTTAGAPLITGASYTAPSWYNGLILTGTTANNYNASFSGTVNITGASTLTGKVGIGAAPNNTYQLYVNGNSLFNGNLIPNATTDTLGSDTNYWGALYIDTSTNGDAYTPIYWSNGKPAKVQIIQQANFTITNSGDDAGTATISTNTSANSMVVEIVVKEDSNSHISNLQSPITWEVSNGTIVLTATVGGRIDGYILYTK